MHGHPCPERGTGASVTNSSGCTEGIQAKTVQQSPVNHPEQLLNFRPSITMKLHLWSHTHKHHSVSYLQSVTPGKDGGPCNKLSTEEKNGGSVIPHISEGWVYPESRCRWVCAKTLCKPDFQQPVRDGLLKDPKSPN